MMAVLPSARSWVANSNPIPDVPPVIKIVLLEIFIVASLILHGQTSTRGLLMPRFPFITSKTAGFAQGMPALQINHFVCVRYSPAVSGLSVYRIVASGILSTVGWY